MYFIGIDPSTHTGLVILDLYSNVVVQTELTSKLKDDPQRFLDLNRQLMVLLKKYVNPYESIVCIEGFSYGSQGKGVSTQYGVGWLIRSELIRNEYSYIEVPPAAVKKFATGKGNTKKDEMVLPIYKKWGFEHSSDNVRDAFVLAQIARALHQSTNLTSYQKDVIQAILNPAEKKKKTKKKGVS